MHIRTHTHAQCHVAHMRTCRHTPQLSPLPIVAHCCTQKSTGKDSNVGKGGGRLTTRENPPHGSNVLAMCARSRNRAPPLHNMPCRSAVPKLIGHKRQYLGSTRALRGSLRDQDALTKTVPCWAAVLNAAIKELREGRAPGPPTRADAGGGPAAEGPPGAPSVEDRGEQHRGPPCPQGEDLGGEGGEAGLHLPLWISGNEKNNIEALLPSWLLLLKQVHLAVLPRFLTSLLETLSASCGGFLPRR